MCMRSTSELHEAKDLVFIRVTLVANLCKLLLQLPKNVHVYMKMKTGAEACTRNAHLAALPAQ
jgi:hypothetical protein